LAHSDIVNCTFLELCHLQDDTSVDEVLSLIPSMSRFPVDQIELAINIVIKAKEQAGGGL
jgi:hypothetical protein